MINIISSGYRMSYGPIGDAAEKVISDVLIRRTWEPVVKDMFEGQVLRLSSAVPTILILMNKSCAASVTNHKLRTKCAVSLLDGNGREIRAGWRGDALTPIDGDG